MALASALNMAGVAASRPSASIAGRLYFATDTGTLSYDTGSAWTTVPTGADMDYVCVQEQQTSGTNGGASVAGGVWHARVLNTITADSASIAALSGNDVVLPAGTYRVRATSPFSQAGTFQIRLQNITAGTTLVTGGAQYMAAVAASSHAHLTGRFTLSGSSSVELQYQCSTATATSGLGIAGSFGTEVYSSIEFEKE